MLHSNQIWLYEGEVVVTRGIEHANDSGMVNSWSEDGEEVGQKEWLLLEVKAERFVVTVECCER
jgi:hypothetical protein